MIKIFTTVGLFALLMSPVYAFSQGECTLLNESHSTRIRNGNIQLDLTYSVDFDGIEGAKSCINALSSSFESACEKFEIQSSQSNAKRILVTLQNLRPGAMNKEVMIRGECRESEAIVNANRQLQKKQKFHQMGKAALTLD